MCIRDRVDPVLSWSLETDGHAWAGGKETGRTVLSGTVGECAYLSFALPKTGRPSTAVLKVKLSCDAVECENQWPVFLYPELSCADVRAGLYDPCHIFDRTEPLFQSMTRIADEQEIALDEIDVVLTSRLTPAVLRYVERGGKAVCVQRGTGPLPTVPVAFWREGMIRYGSHPALDVYKRQTYIRNKVNYSSYGFWLGCSDHTVLIGNEAVSYTHLDVYKRQEYGPIPDLCWMTMNSWCASRENTI